MNANGFVVQVVMMENEESRMDMHAIVKALILPCYLFSAPLPSPCHPKPAA